MSVDIVPKGMKQLRACLVCSLVKTFDQFENDGCDNCESVLHLKRNRDNVYDCTSSNFEVRYLNHLTLSNLTVLKRILKHCKAFQTERNNLYFESNYILTSLHPRRKKIKILI